MYALLMYPRGKPSQLHKAVQWRMRPLKIANYAARRSSGCISKSHYCKRCDQRN